MKIKEEEEEEVSWLGRAVMEVSCLHEVKTCQSVRVGSKCCALMKAICWPCGRYMTTKRENSTLSHCAVAGNGKRRWRRQLSIRFWRIRRLAVQHSTDLFCVFELLIAIQHPISLPPDCTDIEREGGRWERDTRTNIREIEKKKNKISGESTTHLVYLFFHPLFHSRPFPIGQ